MENVAFTSVAFGPRYVEQQKRLTKSILDIYPNAIIFNWTEEMPPDASTHAESLYGFKPHAVQYARDQGFDKIIFFDPACILVDKVDYWFETVYRYGVLAAKDDNLLVNYCGDNALIYEGIPNIEGWHLVGGSVYVFDFALALCDEIFEHWIQAEEDGVFGSQAQAVSGLINKHRNDESMMSLALYMNGSEPTPYDVCRYNDVPDPICIKKHFK